MSLPSAIQNANTLHIPNPLSLPDLLLLAAKESNWTTTIASGNGGELDAMEVRDPDSLIANRRSLPSQRPSYAYSQTNAQSSNSSRYTAPFSFQHAIEEEDWACVRQCLEEQPDLSRVPLRMILCGMPSNCTPLHAVLRHAHVPFEIVDALVTAHPAALLQPESVVQQLPLHVALTQHVPLPVIRFLVQAQPLALSHQDSDGNTPLHLAVQYCDSDIVEWLLLSDPQAASFQNAKQRTALHLACARWDLDLGIYERLIQLHEHAPTQPDQYGRLPLHVAAHSPNPRFEVLQLLLDQNASTLLCQDAEGNLALHLMQSLMAHDRPVVLQYLHDVTLQQQRKQYGLLASLRIKKRRPRRKTSVTERFGNTYG